MESFRMELFSAVLVFGFLSSANGQYGVSPYKPSYSAPAYNPPAAYSAPSYSAPAYSAPAYSAPAYSAPAYSAPAYTPQYEKPTYYETYDTQVDYKEANQTRHCGILPTVHHQYGYEKDRVAFGEYPWQVAIMDTYYNYKCAGGLISPRHVITSAYCVDKMSEDQIRVRVGEWDLQSDKNYQEVYKNYELTVCKKHPFYYVPQYGSYGGQSQNYDSQASYAVVILELSADVDFDQYPHVEPVCIPEHYYLSKAYTNEYSYSYGYGSQYSGGQQQGSSSSSNSQQDRNEEGADKDLECFVLGYQESPVERIEYQQPQPYKPASYAYGESYNPSYSYESYEYSRTPRKAKVKKVYTPKAYGYSYGYTPEVDSWEAEYYYDACHADLGSPIFCLVEGKYEEEYYYPAYPASYPEPSYSAPAYSPPPTYTPSYTPSYSPPQSYTPTYEPSYQAPSYEPSYQPSYQAPSYEPSYQPSYPRYKRAAVYGQSYQPSYQPSYEPSYQPSYTPSYQPSYTPSYQPAPYYEEPYYKYPIKEAEPLNREYRRAVLVGVVQYPTQCSYGYGAESKKITATPAKDLVAWIQNVLHTPGSCSYSSYSAPEYYSAPVYSPPEYYSAPVYSPPAPVYSAPAYSPPAPVYSAPAYSPPAPVYSAPAYSPPAPVYSAPVYSAPAYSPPAPAYSAPAYSPSYPSYAPNY